MNRNGEKWSREETILAFDLYFRTPFGKIHKDNEKIQELSSVLGRTPSSVSLKMHNLAHLDPELQKRNVRAMAHGSKLDKEIFQEFANNEGELSIQAQMILAKMRGVSLEKLLEPYNFCSLLVWAITMNVTVKPRALHSSFIFLKSFRNSERIPSAFRVSPIAEALSTKTTVSSLHVESFDRTLLTKSVGFVK